MPRFSFAQFIRHLVSMNLNGVQQNRLRGRRRTSQSQRLLSAAAVVEKLENRTMLTAASVTGIEASGLGINNGSGDLIAGQNVTLTVNFSAPVFVNSTGGSPTLVLNNGATASFVGGSGNSALTFLYTVAPGQDTNDLTVVSMNLNGSTIQNGNDDANLSGAVTNPNGILQIDTTSPFVQSINRNSPASATSSDPSVSYTVTFSEPVFGVDPTDFQVATHGNLTTGPLVIDQISSSVYKVTVTAISGNGTLQLNLVNNRSINDVPGNSLGTNGVFQPQQTFLTGNRPTAATTGDIDGNGTIDVVVANGDDNTISVLLGYGDGTFLPQKTYSVGGNPYGVALADMNGDHKLDLVVINRDNGHNTVGILLGNGDGTFQPQQTFATSNDLTSLVVKDINGDGNPDVIVTHYDTVGVFLGNSNGTLQAEQTYNTDKNSTAVALADINGDGKLDMVVANQSSSLSFHTPSTLSVLLGNGNGTFQSQTLIPIGTYQNQPTSIVIADINNDSKPDLMVGDTSNVVRVLLGNGNGTFQAEQQYTENNTPIALAAADVNGDGKVDVVAANMYGPVSDGTQPALLGTLLGNGNGTFQSQSSVYVGPLPTSLNLVDLNNDGKLDALVTNSAAVNIGGATIGVALNTSGGTFYGQSYTIISPDQIYAPIKAGTESQVNQFTTDTQSLPVVATDSAGNYVVAWQSYGQDGDGWGIYARVFNADGTAKGDEFKVNATTIGQQFLPAVAMDANGNFVITWQSATTGTGTGYDIFARRYNASGVAQGGEFMVNTFTANAQTKASVAMNATGDFVVVWNSASQFAGGDVSTYAKRYNSSGVAQGSEIRVGTSFDAFPSVGIAANGNFVVTYGTQAQLFNASGTSIRTLDTHLVANDARVAMNASGGFAIAAARLYDNEQYAVVVQRYNATGDVQGDLMVGNPANGQSGTFYRVAINNAGQIAVVWQSDGPDGSGKGVFLRTYSPAGVTSGDDIQVNTYYKAAQEYPSVAMDPYGDLVIAWDSGNNQDGSDAGIYSQRYSNSSASLSGLNQTVGFIQGFGQVPVAENVVVNAPTGLNISSATISFTNWQLGDRVDFDNFANLQHTFVEDLTAHTATLTLTGDRTADIYQLVLRTVNFRNVAGDPTAGNKRVAAITVNAGSTTVTGTQTITVSKMISGVNQTVTYVKGAPPVSAAPNLTLTVPGGGSGYTLFTTVTGATVTFANWQIGDRLSFDNTSNLQHSFTEDLTAHTATLTLTGAATAAAYQTTLRSVAFSNVAGNPNTTADRIATFAVNTTGASGSATQTLRVANVLSGLNETTTYLQGAPAVAVAPNVAVNLPTGVNVSSATVSFTNWQGEDRVTFDNTANLQHSFVENLTNHTATLTITGAASAATYQTLLRSVTYRDVAGNPYTVLQRIALITVNSGSYTSSAYQAVAVTSVLSGVNSTLSFKKGSAPVAMAPNINITLPTSTTITLPTGSVNTVPGGQMIASATISFKNWQAEDRVNFVNSANLQHAFTQDLINHTATLTITGNGTADVYQTLLRSVTYQDVAGRPITTTRNATISISAGSYSSSVQQNITVSN